MEIIKIQNKKDINTLASLAKEIWEEHFIPIIGALQVDYMLKNFQSPLAIMKQIDEGYEYYFASLKGEQLGYTAFITNYPKGKLMISKLYLKKEARGKGLGKLFLDFACTRAKEEGLSFLWLTVNRFNLDIIKWYERRGFKIVDKMKKDIGAGFYMDDYIMEMSL